jgi:hypothetical protein
MIEQSLKQIKEKLQSTAQKYGVPTPKLVAVSKNHDIDAILKAYHCGQRDFGENRVQELIKKVPLLPSDIRWHLIGTLQTNKVKYIANFIYCIHSVDSEKLLAEIDKQSKKYERINSVMLQINISKEPQKHGCTYEEAKHLLSVVSKYPNVKIIGLMGIAEDTDDKAKILHQFTEIKNFFEESKNIQHPQIQIQELCIGMSNDYELAIQAHSTMVRIGTAIFGSRNKNL